MSDQCALDKSGGLKEVNDIEFFFSKSEMMPLPSSAALLEQNDGNSHLIVSVIVIKLCPRALTWSAKEEHTVEKMHASITAEQCNEYGAIIKKH